MITFPFGFFGGSATPDDVDLLLNDYPYASGAFALRKLDKNYTGSCIKVRESSGNTLADIGFDSNGDLDINGSSGLLAHVGSANGYIHTWYDQSGLGYDAVQTSNSVVQPRIVNSGTVDTLNGKPAMYLLAANYTSFLLNNSGYGTMSTKYLAYVLGNRSASSTYSPSLGGGTLTGYLSYLYSDNIYYSRDSAAAFASSSTYTDTDQHLIASINQVSVLNMFKDGDAIAGSSTASAFASILTHIGFSGNRYATGYLQEIVYYDEDRYPELTRLMSNVGAKYLGWSDYSLFSTYFDGIDDYVSLGDTLDYGTFTISAWIKADVISVSKWEGIISKRGLSNASKQFNLSLDNTNKIYFWIYQSDGTGLDVLSNSAIVVDTWYHVLAVADGSTLKMYVDGDLQTDTQAYDGTFQDTGSTTKIGESYTHFFNGNIDEVAYWNSDESGYYSTIYNGGVPADLTDLSPTAWWRMGDESGAPYLTNKMAFSKYSMDFDGLADYVDCGTGLNSMLELSDAFSFSAWVKFGNESTNRTIVSNIASVIGYEFRVLDNEKIRFIIQNGGGNYVAVDTSILSIDTWHHIVITYDGNGASVSNMNIYVDGSLDNDSTLSGGSTPIFTPTSTLYIGKRDTGFYFKGNIDEVAFFDSELSSGNVTTIWNVGVPNDISGLNPIAYYRMGEGAIFPKIPNEMAYSKQSLDFDGCTCYVDCGSDSSLNFDGSSAFSGSAWVYYSSGDTQIFGNQEDTGGYAGWSLQIIGSKFRLALLHNSGGGTYLVKADAADFTTNTWKHVAFTYDGSKTLAGIKLYIDGSEITSTTTAGALGAGDSITSTENMFIGARAGNDLFFSGNIDDVSVFTTELPATGTGSIEEIYNNGKPADISSMSGLLSYWKMGDGDYFPTITDSGSGGNDGTADNMAGLDIVLDTPDGWGTVYNESAGVMIQGDTPNGSGGIGWSGMANMGQAAIVQDTPMIAVQEGLTFNIDCLDTNSYPGTGTVWASTVNSANNGTMVGDGISLVGGHMVFSGTNDYVTFPQNTNGITQTPMTVEMWMYRDGTTGDFLFGTRNVATLGDGLCLFSTGTRFYAYGEEYKAADNFLYQGSVLVANAWLQVVFTTAGDAVADNILYINGSPVSWTSPGTYYGVGGYASASTDILSLGEEGGGGAYDFNGKIDIVRTYDRVLTAAEVTHNFEAYRGRFGI